MSRDPDSLTLIAIVDAAQLTSAILESVVSNETDGSAPLFVRKLYHCASG